MISSVEPAHHEPGRALERDGAWTEAYNRFAYFDFSSPTGQIV